MFSVLVKRMEGDMTDKLKDELISSNFLSVLDLSTSIFIYCRPYNSILMGA